MASKSEEILAGLRFLADKASEAGETELVAAIENAIAEVTGQPPATRPAPAQDVVTKDVKAEDAAEDVTESDQTESDEIETADEVAEITEVPEVADVPAGVTIEGLGPVDPLAELAAEVDEAMLDDVFPHTIVLEVTGDGDFNPDEATCLEAVQMVLPTFNEVLEAEFTIGATDMTDAGWSVALVPATMEGRSKLAAMGAGMDAFNATVPLESGRVQITSQVGQPDDIEAATEMGLIRDLPPARHGHQINLGVDQVEDATGVRPQVATLEVTYRRADAAELTVEQVQQIIDSPVSQDPTMGLPRFGELMLVGITPGDSADTKTAVFGVIATGDVDPASMHPVIAALTGMATMYRGSLPFPGIGVVHCTSSVTAVEGTLPEMVDIGFGNVDDDE